MVFGRVTQLDNPEYEAITNIGRCLHFPDARRCNKKSKILAHKINSKMVDVEAKVAWFEPSKSMDEHNFYGNVTYQIDYEKAFDKLGPKLYYIDQEESSTHVYSRVLLTSKSYSLPMVENNKEDFPVLLYGGRIDGAASCGSGNAVKEHVLEIGIELTAETSRWLFQNCEMKYNNHSLANSKTQRGRSYEKHICHRYNTFGENCPFSFTKQEAEEQFNITDRTTLFTGAFAEESAHSECAVLDEKVYESEESKNDYDNHEGQAVEVYGGRGSSGVYGGSSGAFGGSSGAFGGSNSSGPNYSSNFQSHNRQPPNTENDDGMSTGVILGIGAVVAIGAGLLSLFATLGDDKNKNKNKK